MTARVRDAFSQADAKLAPQRKREADAEQLRRDDEAERELDRLDRLAAEDDATFPSRTEDEVLDELVEGLRASARAAVFQNGVWALRMKAAARVIEELRGRDQVTIDDSAVEDLPEAQESDDR